MPTVFASVSITLLLAMVSTMGLSYAGAFPPGTHMIWGVFLVLLLLFFQCLIFGFFIGSGKSIKRVVGENGLSADWVQRTRDYKNTSYPPLMAAIFFTAAAGVAGGGASAGQTPLWLHQALVWLALFFNVRSYWIAYRVLGDNVEAIHQINREIGRKDAPTGVPEPKAAGPGLLPPPPMASKMFFLAAAVWVPYFYMRWSLGSRNFPYWPFLALSGALLWIGWRGSRGNKGL